MNLKGIHTIVKVMNLYEFRRDPYDFYRAEIVWN